MKKTVLCSVLAAGLVAMGLTSCNKKSGAALADGVDSLSYAFGVLNGTDLAMGLKQYPKKVDIDQFIRGMQSTVNSDSAKFSYEFGAAIGSNMKQQIEQMGKQGIEMNKEEILSALFATLKEDSTLISRAQAEEVFRNGMQAIQLKKQKEEAEKLANTPEAKKNKADGEAFLAKKAKEAGAIVRYEYQQGKGNVVRRMFQEIEAQCYILVDADDTYPASEAAKMTERVLKYHADMVVGDRLSSTYFKVNKRRFHNSGNRFMRLAVQKLFGGKVRDVMTGYRALSYRFAKTIPVLSRNFEVETELTVYALENNLQVEEIAVAYKE